MSSRVSLSTNATDNDRETVKRILNSRFSCLNRLEMHQNRIHERYQARTWRGERRDWSVS